MTSPRKTTRAKIFLKYPPQEDSKPKLFGPSIQPPAKPILRPGRSFDCCLSVISWIARGTFRDAFMVRRLKQKSKKTSFRSGFAYLPRVRQWRPAHTIDYISAFVGQPKAPKADPQTRQNCFQNRSQNEAKTNMKNNDKIMNIS